LLGYYIDICDKIDTPHHHCLHPDKYKEPKTWSDRLISSFPDAWYREHYKHAWQQRWLPIAGFGAIWTAPRLDSVAWRDGGNAANDCAYGHADLHPQPSTAACVRVRNQGRAAGADEGHSRLTREERDSLRREMGSIHCPDGRPTPV